MKNKLLIIFALGLALFAGSGCGHHYYDIKKKGKEVKKEKYDPYKKSWYRRNFNSGSI